MNCNEECQCMLASGLNIQEMYLILLQHPLVLEKLGILKFETQTQDAKHLQELARTVFCGMEKIIKKGEKTSRYQK